MKICSILNVTYSVVVIILVIIAVVVAEQSKKPAKVPFSHKLKSDEKKACGEGQNCDADAGYIGFTVKDDEKSKAERDEDNALGEEEIQCRDTFFDQCKYDDYLKRKEYKRDCGSIKNKLVVVTKPSIVNKGKKYTFVTCGILFSQKPKQYSVELQAHIDGKTKQGDLYFDFAQQKDEGFSLVKAKPTDSGTFLTLKSNNGDEFALRIFLLDEADKKINQWCLKSSQFYITKKRVEIYIEDTCPRKR